MDHAHHAAASFWDVAGALALLAYLVAMWTGVVVLWRAARRPVRPWQFGLSAGVVLFGVIGQLGHLQEHLSQVGYWSLNPESKPWMTPWGTALAQGFGVVDPSKPDLGMEILHWVGNWIFLAGVVGVMAMTRFVAHSKARKWGRMGVIMQGIHGLEHTALTLSVALGADRAIGFSTWLGLMPPGPGLWTYRVWWHALANIVGTAIFAGAVYHLWKERDGLRDSFGPFPSSVPVAEAYDSRARQPV